MKVQGGDASSWKLGFRVSEGRPCKFKIFSQKFHHTKLYHRRCLNASSDDERKRENFFAFCSSRCNVLLIIAAFEKENETTVKTTPIRGGFSFLLHKFGTKFRIIKQRTRSTTPTTINKKAAMMMDATPTKDDLKKFQVVVASDELGGLERTKLYRGNFQKR